MGRNSFDCNNANEYVQFEISNKVERRTLTSHDQEFRKQTLDFIRSDPESGRASSRFDRILSSGMLDGGLNDVIK